MAVRDELVRLTMDLVAIPSVSDDVAGRLQVIDFIQDYCSHLPGVHVARHESDGVPSLVAAFDAEPRKSLILNAHVDVVPARTEQFEPYELEGRIYGRGTQDMKGAAAAMLLLLKELASSGEHPSVAWQFVTDEEIGGENGTRYLFTRGYIGDFFVAGEPTDLEIVNRAKGMLWLNLRQAGNPAHGSRPWDGSNPILPLTRGITKLLERYPVPTEAAWRTTITPSVIHGGDAHNRVPSECFLQLDVRYVPGENPEEVLAAIRSWFEDSSVVDLHRGSPLETAEDDAHVRRLAELVTNAISPRAKFRSEHFGSDARFYSEAGIPAVCFGPAGAGLHSHQEWVDIGTLLLFYRIIRELARSY